jgi:methylated-DNA-protein-cysteine methyltransferase related protein
MKKPTDFSIKVIAVIKKIPKGKVATYGQIAKLAGKEHAARGVSWILHSCSKSHKLPWQRVLNSKGQISFPKLTASFVRQMNLLKKEGVKFSESGQIDMTKFQWKSRLRL